MYKRLETRSPNKKSNRKSGKRREHTMREKRNEGSPSKTVIGRTGGRKQDAKTEKHMARKEQEKRPPQDSSLVMNLEFSDQ
jgi:hypothetical protein